MFFFRGMRSGESGRKRVKRSVDLCGLSQVITECEDEISARGIELLREVSTCVGPGVAPAPHHEAFLTQCCARTQRLQKDMDQQEGSQIKHLPNALSTWNNALVIASNICVE